MFFNALARFTVELPNHMKALLEEVRLVHRLGFGGFQTMSDTM